MDGVRFVRTGLLALCLACVANAGTVNILPNQNGTTVIASSITSFSTTGADMLGMLVTVTFADSTTQTVTWAACGATCGQATGAAGTGTWTLGVTGDTGLVSSLTNPDGSALTHWTLTNTSTNLAITSIVLNGVPGNTLFDRDLNSGGQTGTPGGSFGIDYTFSSEAGQNSPFTVNVTYSNLVVLAGAAQPCLGSVFAGLNTATGCGDEWGQLTFAFSGNPFVGTGKSKSPDAVWSFFQDSDTATAANLAPEPFTFGLMAAGLVAVLAYRKRRISGPTN
jgi:hypothetical protein